MTRYPVRNKYVENIMQKLKFDASIGRVLDLVINSIYTNRDIFLRELISNASDACDKLKFICLSDEQGASHNPSKISIIADEANSVIEIRDNGIGMTAADMQQNLGMIAHSGTKAFLDTLQNGAAASNLIGQFGVGFYSAFMVASRVEVFSRKHDSADIYHWESEGQDDYTIEKLDSYEPLQDHCGTIIRLHLKPQEIEYAKDYKIKQIVKTYSDHISVPVYFSAPNQDETLINAGGNPLWMRKKQEVSEAEYLDFYQHIAYSPDEPEITLHLDVEGKIQYKGILFIPQKKPFDLFHPERATRVKLYARKVFITDTNVDIIPRYLRFLRGVIDSEDLPLNISRETLQNNHVIDKIRKSVVSRLIKTFKELSKNEPEKFARIWENFGEVIKEGLCEGAFEEKEELLEVCKFYSLNSPDTPITMDEYISKMLDGQTELYYLSGQNIESMRKNPSLEGFSARGIDVLLLTHTVDEFWVSVVNQFKNKELRAANSADLDLDKIKVLSPANKANKEESTPEQGDIIAFIKQVLGGRVKDVKASNNLSSSPCMLAIPEGQMNTRMESMLLEQKQLKARSAKILEVNLKHPIVGLVAKNIPTDKDIAVDIVNIMYDQACLLIGQEIANPIDFVYKTNALLGGQR